MMNYLLSRWSRVFALALVLGMTMSAGEQVFAVADSASTTPSIAAQESTTTAPATGAVVGTSPAAAQSQSENDVNALTVRTASSSMSASPEATSTPTEDPARTASTTPSALASSTPSLASSTTAVAAQNTASTTASTTASATTGDNGAQGGAGDAIVATGDAYASADAINVINTNIIDSSGLLYFQNLFSALGINLGALDLSYFTSASIPSCASGCNALSVYADNAATTTNTVDVLAATGGNVASSTGAGSATVVTGNAYASGNAVNIINSNFIRSNYLLVAVNDFGNLPGDIVLPDASFFQQLLAHGAAEDAGLSLATSNRGSVANSTGAVADSGGNTASSTGSGSGVVSTGASLSSATSVTQVNTNLVGGTTVFLLFRIWGSWSGTVRGLPSGLAWRQTPLGIEITNAEGNAIPGAALAPGGALSVNATNTAALANNVSVYALTGANHAQAADGTSTVATGNAYASANSVNIVNTNLVGHNWIYAIFNIFGDMSGNISFGQPNLWVGAAAQAGNPTPPDTDVPFTFTIANRGTAAATHVRLSTSFLSHMLRFTTGSSTASSAAWDLGTLAPGQTTQVTVDALTGAVPPGVSVVVPVTALVSSDDTDADPSDNSDNLTIVVAEPAATGSGGPSFSSDPRITVTPQTGAVATTAPAIVGYAALIANEGGNAYDAVATDVIRDAHGAVISRQSWNLGTLAYNDELRVSYSASFASSTEPGPYTNVMTVTGRMHYPDYVAGSVAFAPVSATTTITILPPPAPATAVAPCAPYLTTYLLPGHTNDSAEVRKLQSFLVTRGVGSGVSVTGVFDAATVSAVKRFQTKYAADILDPWGYAAPTGNVYYTTERQINALACAGQGTFALTQAQQEEIDATRSRIAVLRAQATTAVAAQSSAPVPQPAPKPSSDVQTLPAREPEATTSDIVLPSGVEVGVAPLSASSSWVRDIVRAPSAFVASAVSAYRALLSSLGLR